MEPETIEPTNQIASEQDAGSPVDTTETCTTAEPQVPAGERRNGSIRRRLAYLVIACVLPVWIAAGFLLGRDYLSRRALTEQRMLETARSLTIVVDRELGAMQASLRALSNANSLQRGDLAAFDARARMVMEANPGADIILSNADGQQLVNTFRPFGTPLPKRNVADAVRQIYSTEMPVITNVYKGALTGRFVISVDVPVFRDGRVVYDLAMSVPADRFAAVLLQQQLPSGWIGRIYGSNQMMVARFPSAEKFTGRRANTVLGQRMREKAEGMVETINSDGIPMFNSFDRSVASGWTVAIGVPKAIMMAEIWRWLRWALAGTVLLSLSGIALALPLGRSIEQIERAQRLLAAIVESSDDAIYSKNLDGIITTWNKGAERLYGYTAAEAVGRSVSLIVPPEHLEELHDVLQDVRCGEPVERHETVRMHKDGRRVHVTVALAPVKDKRGEVTGSSVVAHDITRRKHAEKRIAHLASFPELNPAPVFESDLDGNVTYANLAAVRIFPDLIQSGLTHALLRKWSSVVELFKTGNERQIVREIEADGSQFLQTIHYTPDLGVIRAYLLDISERQLAEKALTESEERLRTIVELAPEGIFVIGEQGRILQVNQATCDQLGRTRSQLLHLALSDIVAPRFAHRIATLLRGEVPPGPYESAHIRADGSEVPVELSVTKITFREQPAILGIARDISDRRRTEEERAELEQQLRQAQKMEAVGKLAGGIAHDFNNILMVIQSYTEMLQDCLPPHDALRRNTQQVLKASERAASLTRQMLAFSRKQILSPVVLDLNAVIEETAKMLRRLIGEDIDFRVSSAESLWAIEADPDQIVQILMNLCVNARDAMPQGGTLTIATGNVTVEEGGMSGRPYVSPGDYVRLSVTDSGVGISKESQEQIFEPFFTTKEVGKGTGLGLSTVYGIMKQSDGYLWVDSELGQGACFTIYLPRVNRAIAPDMPVAADARPLGTETILVAEDEEALREAVCDYLSSLGYTILAVGSGKEALSAASEHDGHIDLLITDVVMPVMSGRELSQMLGSLYPDLKTIFMSGYTDDSVLRHGIHEQGATFLQKPFALGTLARKVRDTLGQTETVQ